MENLLSIPLKKCASLSKSPSREVEQLLYVYFVGRWNSSRSITMCEEEVLGSAYQKLRGYEPTNCVNKGKTTSYEEARDFINKDQERNCCNVGRDKSVQKWHLPQEEQKVRIKKAADSGTTLYYHDDLLGSEDFPH